MKIKVQRYEGKDRFTINLFGAGEDPFLVIYGCRVVEGSKGRFIGWPARKDDSGKWWNHVQSSDAFTNAILKEYDKTDAEPVRKPKRRDDDTEDEAPF